MPYKLSFWHKKGIYKNILLSRYTFCGDLFFSLFSNSQVVNKPFSGSYNTSNVAEWVALIILEVTGSNYRAKFGYPE